VSQSRRSVDFRSRCPFHPQLMSNLPCALRFTSVVGPRSTVFGGMTSARILAVLPASDERRERSEISTRLGDPDSRVRTDGRMQPSGTSPSRRARPIERLRVPSERRHREGCALSDARRIQKTDMRRNRPIIPSPSCSSAGVKSSAAVVLLSKRDYSPFMMRHFA
jgi:hypothetical protein